MKPAPRLPGIPKRRKGRQRYTRAERRAMQPKPMSCPAYGRALTSPKSIKRGIGPSCAASQHRAFAASHIKLLQEKETP